MFELRSGIVDRARTKLPDSDVVANFKYRDNLENIIEKHYKMTKYKNARDEVNEVKKIFDKGLQELAEKKELKAHKFEMQKSLKLDLFAKLQGKLSSYKTMGHINEKQEKGLKREISSYFEPHMEQSDE